MISTSYLPSACREIALLLTLTCGLSYLNAQRIDELPPPDPPGRCYVETSQPLVVDTTLRKVLTYTEEEAERFANIKEVIQLSPRGPGRWVEHPCGNGSTMLCFHQLEYARTTIYRPVNPLVGKPVEKELQILTVRYFGEEEDDRREIDCELLDFTTPYLSLTGDNLTEEDRAEAFRTIVRPLFAYPNVVLDVRYSNVPEEYVAALRDYLVTEGLEEWQVKFYRSTLPEDAESVFLAFRVLDSREAEPFPRLRTIH